jgi:hypothetical protein
MRIHPQNLKCGEEFVARCAQIEFSTKCQRDCSEEQRKIEEGKIKRESGGNIQGKESLNFSSNLVGNICPRREVNNPRPSDLVKLQRRKP